MLFRITACRDINVVFFKIKVMSKRKLDGFIKFKLFFSAILGGNIEKIDKKEDKY
jgi:hypothetical protein